RRPGGDRCCCPRRSSGSGCGRRSESGKSHVALGPLTAGVSSNASSAAEADRHLLAVDDHRNGAPTLGVAEHPVQIGWLLLDVDVFERNMPPLIVVTGGSSVGSSIFAENHNHDSLEPLCSRGV